MKQKRKEMWEHMRVIGMIRFTLLLGGFWSGFVIVLTTLIELWPDGKFLSFGNFLFTACCRQFQHIPPA